MADYRKMMEASPVYQEILKKMRNRTATYKDVGKLAKALGKLSGTYAGPLIGDSATEAEILNVVMPIMTANHGAMAGLVQSVQNQMYREIGLGLTTVAPGLNRDAVLELVQNILAHQENGTMTKDVAEKEFTTYTWRQGDEAVNRAVKDANNLGLELRVTRTYDGVGLHGGKDPCTWCEERAGTWTYRDAAQTGFVFARHVGCNCEIAIEVERRIRPR